MAIMNYAIDAKKMLLVFLKKKTKSLKITGSNASFNFIKILIIIASIIN